MKDNDNKYGSDIVSTIVSLVIGLVVLIAAAAGLVVLLEKIDYLLKKVVPKYETIKEFAGLLLNILVPLAGLVFIWWYVSIFFGL